MYGHLGPRAHNRVCRNGGKYALFWDITRRRVVFLCRRFGTRYRSHLQGVKSPFLLGPLILEDGTETSVKNCHTAPRNIPEECRAHQHRGGSLKSWLKRIQPSWLVTLQPHVKLLAIASPITVRRRHVAEDVQVCVQPRCCSVRRNERCLYSLNSKCNNSLKLRVYLKN